MFEVTIARLAAIATAQIAIGESLVLVDTTADIITAGANSPRVAVDLAAVSAAKISLATSLKVAAALETARVVITNAAIAVGGVGATQAGENASLTAAVAGSA